MGSISQELYGIPRDRVIGSATALEYVSDDSGGTIDVDEDLVSGKCRRLVHLEDLDGLAECFDPGHSLAPWRHGGRSEFDASTAEVMAAPAG